MRRCLSLIVLLVSQSSPASSQLVDWAEEAPKIQTATGARYGTGEGPFQNDFSTYFNKHYKPLLPKELKATNGADTFASVFGEVSFLESSSSAEGNHSESTGTGESFCAEDFKSLACEEVKKRWVQELNPLWSKLSGIGSSGANLSDRGTPLTSLALL